MNCAEAKLWVNLKEDSPEKICEALALCFVPNRGTLVSSEVVSSTKSRRGDHLRLVKFHDVFDSVFNGKQPQRETTVTSNSVLRLPEPFPASLSGFRSMFYSNQAHTMSFSSIRFGERERERERQRETDRQRETERE